MILHIRDAVPDDAEALAHVMVSSMQAAFRGIVPDHCLKWPDSAANWRLALMGGLAADDFLHVAEIESGQVVAYAMGGLCDDPLYRGELKQISVLPAYHGQGMGKLLVVDVARQLAQQSISSMCVRVLKDNPNRPFYEHLGGQFVRQRPFDWDGFMTSEYTYGWKDTAPLLEITR